jgi:hypothetical protein
LAAVVAVGQPLHRTLGGGSLRTVRRAWAAASGGGGDCHPAARPVEHRACLAHAWRPQRCRAFPLTGRAVAAAFLPPLVAASGFDLVLRFVLAAVGSNVLNVVRPDPPVVACGVTALAGLGLDGWLLIVRRRSARPSNREALAAGKQPPVRCVWRSAP